MIEQLLLLINNLIGRDCVKDFVKYCNSTELTDLMKSINSTLKISKGETKVELDHINHELELIIDNFMKLMVNTKDFIENATDLFEKMDINIAEQISKT